MGDSSTSTFSPSFWETLKGAVDNDEEPSSILTKDPRLFVEKFWKSMSPCHIIKLKDKLSDDGFFTLYSRKIRNLHRKAEIERRNRRYLAMKTLMESDEFFTLAQMKTRNPVLYDELVGQLMSAGDVNSMAREEYEAYSNVSQMLLGQIDNMRVSELYSRLLANEGEAGLRADLEGNDEEEEEEMEDDDEGDQSSNGKRTYSAEEKAILTREFVSQMEGRFLSGVDDHLLDYKDVSCKAIGIPDQDEEDEYFDSEEPRKLDNDRTNQDDVEFPCEHILVSSSLAANQTTGQTKLSSKDDDDDIEDYMAMDLSKI